MFPLAPTYTYIRMIHMMVANDNHMYLEKNITKLTNYLDWASRLMRYSWKYIIDLWRT
jgi:hypothetical protein